MKEGYRGEGLGLSSQNLKFLFLAETFMQFYHLTKYFVPDLGF